MKTQIELHLVEEKESIYDLWFTITEGNTEADVQIFQLAKDKLISFVKGNAEEIVGYFDGKKITSGIIQSWLTDYNNLTQACNDWIEWAWLEAERRVA